MATKKSAANADKIMIFMCGCTSANSALLIALLRELKRLGLMKEPSLARLFSDCRRNLQDVPDMPAAMRAAEIWLAHLQRLVDEIPPAAH